jgi:hypothetical protein
MDSRRTRWAILSLVLVAAGGGLPAHAEERTIQAAARLSARARVFVTGPEQAFIVGAFGARVQCPATVEADYRAKTQQAEGRCVITTRTGDRLFSRWKCAGEPDQGCRGRFTLTGGTGAYQGVSGEGDIVLRLVLSDLVKLDRQEAEYDLTAAATWPELRYQP